MIDAHVHFWKFHPQKDAWINDEMEVLQRDFLPEDLQRLNERYGIDGVVAVQAAQTSEETVFLCSLAQNNPWIAGVVGWIDLRQDNIAGELQKWAENTRLKGFRHILQAEPKGFMLDSRFVRGVEALKMFDFTYDILVFHDQLDDVIEFCDRLPGQKFMIDHCAKPDIRGRQIDLWEEKLCRIAQHPNVYCKVSGLVTEALWHRWEPTDFYPYLDVVFDSFGADRVVYGSDWPVIYASATYGKWLQILNRYMESRVDEDREKFFHTNAKQFYQL